MSAITNVLIFKDGYYYLTTANMQDNPAYQIILEDKFTQHGIDRNGFEFASDAYRYLAEVATEERIKMVGDDDARDKQ